MPWRLLSPLLTLPWLWPFTFGPLAGAQPYLVSLAVAGLALALWPARAPGRGAAVWAVSVLAAAALSSAIGLLQYFNLEAPFFPFVNIAEPGMAFGNLRQPNQLATLLALGLVALRWLERHGQIGAGAGLALAALLVVGLAATASRTGLLELLALAALCVWWGRGSARWRRELSLLGLLLGLYALALLVLPALLAWSEGLAGRDLLARLRSGESGCGSRRILWANVLHLIGLRPWTGWGWGELDWAHYSTLYDGPRFCAILDNAHNLSLHLAVELGVPAALAACALVGWCLWRSRPWCEQAPLRQLAWGTLLMIGLHSAVEYPLWYGPFQIAALISLWLLWTTRGGRGGASPPPAGAAPGTALRLGAAALLLAATAYAGWDYWRVSQPYLPSGQRAPAYRDDPLSQARRSWLYADLTRFTAVTTQPLTSDNAAWMLDAAQRTLHFSPEPRVALQVIEAARRQEREDLARWHLARLRAAFPLDHQRWAARQRPPDDSGAAPRR